MTTANDRISVRCAILALLSPQSHPSPQFNMDLQSGVQILLADDLDLNNVQLHNKRVLHRADLNVPLTNTNGVADTSRLDAILPTLRLLLSKGARVALASHLGRPQPSQQTQQEMRQGFSLEPVAELLRQHLGPAFVGLVPDISSAAAAVAALQPGQACLLENLRFWPGEAANDPGFARQLAGLADVFVNDAFGVCHRNQASITGVVPHMSGCYPGLLMRDELRHLSLTCNQPRRPFGVVIGGAKVADKIGVISSLITRANVLLIGGRMAFTFLAAEGVAVGATQIEHDWLEPCRQMRQLAAERGVKLLLPVDVVVAANWDDGAGCCTVPLTPGCCSQEAPCVPPGCFGLDIGPQTAAAFSRAIQGCQTLFWNGPMGRFEVPGFAAGTEAVARAIGRATEAGATTVIGGGDSVSAAKQLQPQPRFSFISTGGGASLELLRGSLLPGIRALATCSCHKGLVCRQQADKQQQQAVGTVCSVI